MDAPDNSPLVSVIITCFNQKRLITETVLSVLGQTHRNLECIVVNDGSTDGVENLLTELAERDPRVRLINQRNAGVTHSRNVGFAKSAGEFIQFLDGDDLLDPTKLEKQIIQFRRDPEMGVSWTHHRFCNMEATSFKTHLFEPIDERPLEQFLFGWCDGISLPVHAPLYRRSLWAPGETPYPQDYADRCEDWVFLVLVAMKGTRFVLLDETLCTYRMADGAFTSDLLERNVAYVVAAAWLQNRIPEHYRTRFFRDAVRRSLGRYVEERKSEILQSSWNWRVGNFLSRPVFAAAKLVRGLR